MPTTRPGQSQRQLFAVPGAQAATATPSAATADQLPILLSLTAKQWQPFQTIQIVLTETIREFLCLLETDIPREPDAELEYQVELAFGWMIETIGNAWQPLIRPADRAAVARVSTHIRAAMRKAGVTTTSAPPPPPPQRHRHGPSTMTSGAKGDHALGAEPQHAAAGGPARRQRHLQPRCSAKRQTLPIQRSTT